MKLFYLRILPCSFFIFFIIFSVDVKCKEEIKINGVNYKIEDKDSTKHLLKIKRIDISDDLCLANRVNTSLNSTPFEFDPDAPYITLFYGCPPNEGLTCGTNTNNGIYYTIGSESSSAHISIISECNSSVVIYTLPNIVNEQMAALQQFPPDIEALKAVTHGGFNVIYDEKKYEECQTTCLDKGKNCVYNGGNLKCVGGTSKIPTAVNVVIGVGAGFCIILLIICWSIQRRKSSPNSVFFWNHKSSKQARKVEDFLSNFGFLAPKRYSYKDIKKMTNSFETKLGQGGFGSVFKGKLLDGQLVAVKLMGECKGSGEDFINEVASISRTSHVNIVSLLGFCFNGLKRALIYEFMPNGSLEKFIYADRTLGQILSLPWEKLYEIVGGVARGLEYLHRGCNTRIVHFDIKPHNILLDADFSPKISDFGLAKLCITKDSVISMLGTRGTPGYIAPEVFCRSMGGVSHKSDVYSYGMMVLEIVGGRKNIHTDVDHTSEIFFPHWIHKRLELHEDLGLLGVTLEMETVVKKMLLVGLWCIQTNPVDRPSMRKVVEMLEGSLESLRIPPQTILTSPSRSEQIFVNIQGTEESCLENSHEA